MRKLKLRKRGVLVALVLAFTFLLLPMLEAGIENVDDTGVKTQLFRPFYSGYAQGSVLFYVTNESSSLTREWNFEAWNVSQVNMTLRLWNSTLGTAAQRNMTLYLSIDKGSTWPHSYNFTIPQHNFASGNTWGTGYYYEHVFPLDGVIPLNTSYWEPKTRIKFEFEIDTYFCNVYWGSTQYPTPPYDYLDGDSNFVQYYILFLAEYTENEITYVGSTESFEWPTLPQSLLDTAEMIINSSHPSGVSNEVIDKTFGRDTWVVIYSSQLGMRSLINLSRIFPQYADRFLITARRFIPYMFSNQYSNGSFPFQLIGGDQHVYPNSSQDGWYGNDRIDSFSALSISLLYDYYMATNDTNIIDTYWDEIRLSGYFLESLNTSSALPLDGYHYNGTDWNKSEWVLLHDAVEVQEGLDHLALLYDLKGDPTNKTKYENWAANMRTAILNTFWNETLGRYVGYYKPSDGTYDTTIVYNVITPIVYGIEANVTRASSTVQTYLDWGLLGGRYYNASWTIAWYNPENEYSTMSGMAIKALSILRDLGYTEDWVEYKLRNLYAFLYNNPILGGSMQNPNGWLDWVRFSDNTQAPDWARLIEASAWVMEGVMAYPIVMQDYFYLFRGLYNEDTGIFDPASVNVSSYFTDGTDSFFFNVNGTYYYTPASIPKYFEFNIPSSTSVISQYGSNLIVYNQSSYYDVLFVRYEDDANYNVGVTLTWNTTYTITNKATTGFRINFDTPPVGDKYLSWHTYRTTTETQQRQYWLSDDEDNAVIYIFDDTLTEYTVAFLDLAGALDDYPMVEARYYINGTLRTVDKRKVDLEDKVLLSLVNGRKYTLTIKDGSSYTFGELTTSSVTTITLTLKGIEFPKETLLTYKFVRIYWIRAFGTPNGNITVTYQDTLSQTNSVEISFNYRNDTNAYNATETADSFIHTWSSALNNTDYWGEATIDHAKYGVYTVKQFFPRHLSANPWGLDFLGTSLPFATNILIPILIILFVGGSFSVLNAELGAFMAVVAAILVVYMWSVPIPTSYLIVAFSFAICMGIIYAKRRVET